jgi:hypothetical protein
MIVLVVAAPVPRLRGGGLAAALVVAAVGSVLAHTSGGLYQDWRAGTARVAAQIRAGDAVTLTHRAVAPAFEYYAAGTAAQGAPVAGFNEGVGFDRFTRERRRVWFFASPPVPRAVLESGFATVGYRPLTAWRFGGNDPLQLVLAVPGRP